MPKDPKHPLSEEKLAANRANAQKSTGPKTGVGKEKSSQNSWKHGAFAKRLFKTKDQEVEDREDYDRILEGVFYHYEPVGPMESYWAERIAVEMLRSIRLVAHVQESLCAMNFIAEGLPIEIVLRVQAANTRQLELAIKQLERLQQIRKSLSQNEPRDNQGELQIPCSSKGDLDQTNMPVAETSKVENCETSPDPITQSKPSSDETP